MKSVVIIGAGPAGLTAGYLLAKEGVSVSILESDPRYVGGISRTEQYKGFRFDIGGHRFFSKSEEVEKLWDEILPHDMLIRPRSSRIFYRKQFFSYPLKPFEALRKLGLVESFLCMLSYLYARIFPIRNPRSFAEWVRNKFGQRLFSIFFRTYTEKVWGMSCDEISADWAAQRIKGLSLVKAVLSAFLPKPSDRSGVVKTLVSTFRYPRLGPGMMWEECARKIQDMGGTITMGRSVTGLHYDNGTWTITHRGTEGGEETATAEHVLSSAPVRHLIAMLSPALSEQAQHAARSLRYRDFLTVALVCDHEERFTDNWIYIHDPKVHVGRIQNFKSWSPEMLPEGGRACYGLEYFCFEGDQLWASSDADLIALATREMMELGLIGSTGEVVDACVVRQPKAYPVYDDHYSAHMDVIRGELDASFPTLHLAGRNGLHKYNNQDHSMMTALLAARNILAGYRKYDVWDVNEDAEYHESGQHGSSGLRSVPARVA